MESVGLGDQPADLVVEALGGGVARSGERPVAQDSLDVLSHLLGHAPHLRQACVVGEATPSLEQLARCLLASGVGVDASEFFFEHVRIRERLVHASRLLQRVEPAARQG